MTDGRVLCLGEALVDVVARGDQVGEHVGGSVLNVASGLARLEHPASLASWWAKDRHGRLIEDAVHQAGVEIVPGSDGAERTSVAYATLDAEGKASYQFDLSTAVPPLDLSRFGHTHTGSIGATVEPGGSQVVEVVRRIRERSTVSYDPNARPTLMGSPQQTVLRVEELVGLSDVVKASDEDVAWLYPGTSIEEVLRHWLSLGPALVVCTLGSQGAVAMLRDGQGLERVPPMTVTVGDTVGCGDSFMAGMLSGLLADGLLGGPEARQRLAAASWADVQPALKRAVVTSGITATHAGAYGPTLPEVRGVQEAHPDLA